MDTVEVDSSRKPLTKPYNTSQNIEDLSISGSLPSFSTDSQAMILPDPPMHEPGEASEKKVKRKSKGAKIKNFFRK